ncbi:Glycosyltransferase involved in cell wall bisynthesis [Butyrivibrio sp. ob235]|uniref:glycosyltransferase n=1 Tax=Butyrivibrio sp. ob235 TaxID=1761780 RepID=UPI0008BAEEAC|nr:glycosyltransferase [Butyrivibrio sp. ob235]SEL82504.1 Glycosyltransferase involved in cell wall bisynthesis [Butyrivibrio sp. ob235]
MTGGGKLRKKHIAMYIGSLNKGGAERVMCNLAEYFYSIGYKVTLATTYLSDDEYELPDAGWKVLEDEDDKNAVKVLSPDETERYVDLTGGVPMGIGRVFTALMPYEQGNRLQNFHRRIQKLTNTWERIKPDLILSFLGKNNVMAIQSALGLDIPVVVSVRATPSEEYAGTGLNLAMKTLFPGAAGVVVQTNGAMDYFGSLIKTKCKVLPNAVNEEFIGHDIVPFDERKKVIVSVGRLDENKNQKILINAFSYAVKKYPDYRLVLYGDGPTRDLLERLCRSLGILDETGKGADGKVTFMGSVDRIADRIAEAEIFVLTSRTEGMPNALIEAMALGLCCISTDCPCGGPADLIVNGRNGILIPMESDVNMAMNIFHSLERIMEDPTIARKMAASALEVRDKYNPQVINEMWRKYFEELM